MTFKITILGSGTIVPSRDRSTTSIVFESAGRIYMLDCGPGSLEKMTASGFDYRDLDTLFISHFHVDHSLGLAHLFSALKNDRVDDDRAIRIVCPDGAEEYFNDLDRLYPGVVAGIPVEITPMKDGDILRTGDIEVKGLGADHCGVPALSLRIFGRGGTDFVYTGDTAYTERLAEFARGTDMIISECSVPDSMAMEGHMTPGEAARLAEASGTGRLVLVHMYPFFEDLDPAVEAAGRCSVPVIAARDGMTIDI